MTAPRHLIINADDLGASEGINRGILEAHEYGVVTSASLMVHGPAAAAGVQLAAAHPHLALGLHWDLDREPAVDLEDPEAVRAELEAQLARFEALVGRRPTHVDGHHHVQKREEVAPAAQAIAARLRVPLRGVSPVRYIGGFYAQWEWKKTELEHISVDALRAIVRDEVAPGWTEIGCHPGYITPGFRSVYLREREAEIRTLTDPAVREEIEAQGVRLVSFAGAPA